MRTCTTSRSHLPMSRDEKSENEIISSTASKLRPHFSSIVTTLVSSLLPEQNLAFNGQIKVKNFQRAIWLLRLSPRLRMEDSRQRKARTRKRCLQVRGFFFFFVSWLQFTDFAGMTPEAYQAYYQQYYQYYMMAMQQQQMMAQQQGGGGLPSQYSSPPGPAMPSGPPPPPAELSPPPLEQIPTNVLWVGFPGQSVPEEDLRPVFAAFGMLENIKMISVKNCAFVTFSDKVDAWKCLTTLSRNPQTIRGCSLRLGWGKADANAGSGGGDRDRGGGIAGSNLPLAPPSNSLWLGSVPFDITEDELYGPFARFGTIDNIRLLPQKKCAFITYMNVAEAELAMREMQGQMLRGERLKINFGHGGTTGGKKGGDEELRLAPVPEVGPPGNKDVAAVIEQLAGFVHRLGSAFEEKVKDIQKANPRFEFLFGGTGQDYYEWRKYDLREKENLATSHLAPWQRASAASSSSSSGGGGSSASDVVLSATDQQRLSAMLDRLQPTQESIREAKDWIMARARLCNDIVGVFRAKMSEFAAFPPRLHLLYLVNDVLLHSSRAQQDYFGPALQRYISDLCFDATRGDVRPEQKAQISDLVNIWIQKQFYARDFLEDIRARIDQSLQKKAKTDPWAY